VHGVVGGGLSFVIIFVGKDKNIAKSFMVGLVSVLVLCTRL